jgi:hypothetical protein
VRRTGVQVVATLVASINLLVANGASAADTFTARLATVPIDTATSAAIAGSGSATATLDGAMLTVEGSFSGMRGPATVARVHEGPVTGVRGPAVHELAVPAASSGEFSAKIALTPELVRSLREGRLYVQIASETAPDGNLWGWLLQR